ncbi:PEP-CTERM sorting domain-containing protein [Alteromonas macleodii]|uniref:Putative secreted protein with PEP-CTERM sorting signal n=1 Tax=Alteromonas macleodii TaxID=28108 RepID=A0A6T9Y2G8_ALTMA|nr:PEP-CTERM sorting domain-containing protein [Alteromonas macleodii]CAB9494399.1 putative secreted protein with PEP-CTERM sorting signal [Alteromonas macleodii]
MKKFFLLLMAAATFNANAALISITTDKDTYNVGETIMATVSATDLIDDNAVQTYFWGYDVSIFFDTLFVSFDPSTIMELGAFGGLAAGPLNSSTSDLVSLTNGVLFVDMEPIQKGKDEIALFSFALVALSDGLVELSFSKAELSNNIGFSLLLDTPQGTSFEIAQVPAPGTFALSLLALGGMFFARKRAKS